MTEFIGSRISLVSQREIRYVGTLHEINSEASTVALENVKTFGTEGRMGGGEDEIAPSDEVYEYIVFRGTDVKDLRIEEAPVAKENRAPQVPNDPAIMSSSSRPPPSTQPKVAQNQQQGGPPQRPGSQGPPPPGGPPPFAHHPQYPPPFYGHPPPSGWGGRGGPPGPPFPPMGYGAPPGWYPPPGQPHGFPPGPFPPYGYPPQGPPGPFQQGQMPKPGPIGPTPTGGRQQGSPTAPAVDAEPKSLARPAAEMAAAAVTKAPTPPAAKPSPSETPVAQPSVPQSAATAAVSKAASTGPKPNRIQPAVPLQSPALTKTPLQSTAGNVASPPTAGTAPASLRDATQAATAAVAAAMAKLPNQQQNGNALDNLTKQVNAMRTTDPIRAPRGAGTSTNFSQGRGRGRGGARNTQKVEVPTTDFDFETSNAKFNKDDLVKEAIAGSPLGETGGSPDEPDVPAAGYNKTKSFFDDISSESKDRTDGGGGRPGGREWRGEEQKKNVETFGQGSVDNGYRGGYRGRGRGRGYRGGRGFGGDGQPRGRGGYRGRGAQVTTQ